MQGKAPVAPPDVPVCSITSDTNSAYVRVKNFVLRPFGAQTTQSNPGHPLRRRTWPARGARLRRHSRANGPVEDISIHPVCLACRHHQHASLGSRASPCNASIPAREMFSARGRRADAAKAKSSQVQLAMYELSSGRGWARAAIISKTIVCCIYYRCCVSRAAKTRIPATSRRDCGHELAVKAAAAGVVLSVTACPWARPPPLTAGAAGSGNCAPPRACTGRRWPPTASGALNSSPETPLANGSGSSRSTPAMCVPSLLLCLSTSCLALLPGRPHRLRESPSGCCSYFVFIRRYIVSTLTASKSGLFLAVHILCPACQHLTP